MDLDYGTDIFDFANDNSRMLQASSSDYTRFDSMNRLDELFEDGYAHFLV